MNLVVVESPAKAKTINKYLGPDFKVLASFGHVRDLPSKEGSVKPEKGFAMHWAIDPKSRKHLNQIEKALKEANALYLATDPDREGEAIAWHVLDVLAKKKALGGKTVKRVAFNAITKSAVREAMKNPRELDQQLINAYLARRALDYLVGFTLSPVLWRKLPGARSAGRVQSVALRLVVDRELEIDKFKPREYWSVKGLFRAETAEEFEARLYAYQGRKLKKKDIENKGRAEGIKATAEAKSYRIAEIEKKPLRRNPAAPFTTSTLQQEAARKFGFRARQTMQIAQKLYEGKTIDGQVTGLITYMRTDGVSIAGEAIAAARGIVEESFGEKFLPKSPRVYKSKAKNAQEAHEAIRPVNMRLKPGQVAGALSAEELKLYDLIWKRTLASQMASARLEQTAVSLVSDDDSVQFRASGTVTVFEGFFALYREGRDDRKERGENQLPALQKGQQPDLLKVKAKQHFTEPPPRFTEASLVKRLEELGIGRPSTYASTLSVLRDRNYVHMEKGRFIPEDKGIVVTAFLESFFDKYVEYDFTAGLEEQLDRISAGKADWKELLNEFWNEFNHRAEDVLAIKNREVLDNLNEHLEAHIFPVEEEGVDPRACKSCGDGRLSLKVGRYGAFIGCSNYPECRFTKRLGTNGNGRAEGLPENGEKVLGKDPESGLDVTLRSGRYGPYLQLGAAGEKGEKPKRAPVPKDKKPADIGLEEALKLLSLPRQVGNHPETGKPINASIGRYGPYVAHDGKFASLSSSAEVFEVGVNRAVALLAESKKGGNRRGSTTIKDLGEHPKDGKPVRVLDGRYGPYVKHQGTNATVPKGTNPETLSMSQALEILEAKKAKAKAKRS